MELDRNDQKILDILKENSRLSSREISEKTGIRPSTVHSRIQRLTKDGIIEKFSLKLNNDILGKNFVVYLFVETKENIPNKCRQEAKPLNSKFTSLFWFCFGRTDLIVNIS